MRWTTTSSHACFRARSNCPRRILKHEERRFREVRLWCSTALDRTRRPAPVWRSHSNGKESRTCDHSPADCKAGWNAVTPSNRPRVMWSDVYQHSLRGELMRTLGVLVLFTTICATQVTDAHRQLFEYDLKQPLDVKQKQLKHRPWARVFAIDYASPHGGRVTGFLVEPTATGKHPAIVFGHWGPGNATEFVPEAIMYARAGIRPTQLCLKSRSSTRHEVSTTTRQRVGSTGRLRKP